MNRRVWAFADAVDTSHLPRFDLDLEGSAIGDFECGSLGRRVRIPERVLARRRIDAVVAMNACSGLPEVRIDV